MENEKRCKVTIFGDEYTLIASESVDHIVRAAHMVDSNMQEIARISPGGSSDKKVAVLAALRIASILLMIENEQEKEKSRHEYLADRINHALRST